MTAEIFGTYILCEKIASTSMAEYFLALRPSTTGTSELVTVKRVHPSFSDVPEFAKMFRHEAALSQQLNHPNLHGSFDSGEIEQRHFMVMEYLRGRTLDRLLKSKGMDRLQLPTALGIVREVALGLHALHAMKDSRNENLGIIKRDLCPNEIFLTGDGRVKIMGLSVAKSAIQLEQTNPGTIKGKFSYMSPEQTRIEPMDQRSDIYSLGLILWEVINGTKAFQGRNDTETFNLNMNAELPNLSAHPTVEKSGLQWILDNALAIDPRNRYENAAQMARDLSDLTETAPTSELLRAEMARAFGPELQAEALRAERYLKVL